RGRPSSTVCVLVRKLRTPVASRRRPHEPIARLPRGDGAGGAGRPPRLPRREGGRRPGPPPPPPPAAAAPAPPYWGMGWQIRRAGDEFPGPRAYPGSMDGNEVRGIAATFVTDPTTPPAPRPPWLRRGRFDLVEIADVITALICFA